MIKLTQKLSGALVFVLLLAGAAYAYEAVDLGRSDCSLNVVMKYDGEPVTVGSLALYRVGGITENNGELSFELRPELNCDADMERLQSEKTANEVCDCVKRRNLSGVTVNIDAEGVAAFRDLTAGLYLVRQGTASPGFSPIKPFLISVPQWDGERYVYNITAAAKTELHRLRIPPDKPNPPSELKLLPQTGQLNWPVPVLLMFGGTFLFAGITMRRKNDA